MTNTKQQLSTWSDSQILKSLTPKFDELIESWLNDAHPEILWNDGYYFEYLADKLTDEQKKKWYEFFLEEFEEDLNAMGGEFANFDELLTHNDWLGEEIGEWFSEQPENKDEFIIFTFKFFLDNPMASDDWEENLLPFLSS